MQKTTKNIVICVPFFSLGGAETQAYNIAKGFKEAGHNVTVVAFDEKSGLLRKKLCDLGINCELIPYQLNWVHEKGAKKFLGLLKVIFFLRKFKPDFLFPFTYYPNIILSSIWRFTGAKKCFWNQRGLECNAFNAIENLAKRSKPSYLSNSKTGADYIAKRHSFPLNEVNVIRNGVELSNRNTSEDWKTKLGFTKNDLVYTVVANIYPEKNHKYLLKAWSIFCEQVQNENLKLVLIGYPANIKFLWELKALAFDMSIKNIHFFGSSQDIPGLLAITHCGILTSEREGCPNSVLEMMQQKVPVIVSKIPATEEIFDHDYPLFCDLGSEKSLVEALKKTLEFDFLKRLTLANHELVNKNYNLNRLKHQYLHLIK